MRAVGQSRNVGNCMGSGKQQEVVNRLENVLNECPSWEVDAKDFRDLVDHNDQPDTCSKTNEYRLGDKVRHESKRELLSITSQAQFLLWSPPSPQFRCLASTERRDHPHLSTLSVSLPGKLVGLIEEGARLIGAGLQWYEVGATSARRPRQQRFTKRAALNLGRG